MPPDPEMARQVWANVAERHPAYVELHDVLSLAAETWPRFGIGAAELAEMDEMSLAQLRLALAE